ncbi:MAG: NAD(P)-dependent alcohol dehydrogenase [Sphingomonadales bacterium]
MTEQNEPAEILSAVFSPGERTPALKPMELVDMRPDEVRVRIVATGICHTDITLRDRLTQSTILGHEGAGVVEAVGADVRKVVPGDHVVLSFHYCGVCDSCSNHAPSYCRQMPVLNLSGRRADGSSALALDGQPVGSHFFGQSSFSTVSIAHERNVVKVPMDAPLELLGPLGCGFQTGAGTVLNVLKPEPGSSLAVIGCGAVGMSAVMAARIRGCNPIIAIEPNEQRCSLVWELGAHIVLDPKRRGGVGDAVRAAAPDGVNYLIDTSGLGSVVSGFVELMAPRAKVVALAVNAKDPDLKVPLAAMIGRGLTVKGVVEGESLADTFIPELVRLYLDGDFPIDRLVQFYDFKDINHAIEDHEQGRAVKPVLRMDPR